MVLLRGVGASEFAGCTPSVCEGHGLRHKAMLEVRKLRQQLTNTVNAVSPSNGVYLDPKLAPPTQEQVYDNANVVTFLLVFIMYGTLIFIELQHNFLIPIANA